MLATCRSHFETSSRNSTTNLKTLPIFSKVIFSEFIFQLFPSFRSALKIFIHLFMAMIIHQNVFSVLPDFAALKANPEFSTSSRPGASVWGKLRLTIHFPVPLPETSIPFQFYRRPERKRFRRSPSLGLSQNNWIIDKHFSIAVIFIGFFVASIPKHQPKVSTRKKSPLARCFVFRQQKVC